MKLNFTITLVTLLFSFNISAQHSECGTDAYHKHRMQTDAEYSNQVNALEAQIKTILQNNRSSSDPLLTIPLVIHVIHLGEAVGTGSNISDAQIHAAVTGLNNRWRNFIGSGVDVQVEFCLATRDPSGSATTGINRVDGSAILNYSSQGISLGGCATGAEENSVKALSRWPVSEYYNVWVVNMICSGQWAGWAYYPYGGVNDGATVAAGYMTGSSAILTHEVGHGFFAYHTFEGDGGNSVCPTNTDCTLQGDRVCDTPPHKQSDCSTVNPCDTAAVWDNSRYNYMSYCSGTNRFTLDQKDRMRTVANTSPRLSLLSSEGCSAPVAINDLNIDENIISIDPNPSAGNLTLHASYALTDCRVEIINIVGKEIYTCEINRAENNSKQIDLNISAGIYFVKIHSGERQFVRKIIIE
jgi:hypothetical protein